MSGQPATLIKSVPEICVVSGEKESSTADGPPVFESFVPEMLFVSVCVDLLTADGPPLGRGRFARA